MASNRYTRSQRRISKVYRSMASVRQWCYALFNYEDERPARPHNLSIVLAFCCWEIDCYEGHAGTARQLSPAGARRGSSIDLLDVTNLPPWTRKRALLECCFTSTETVDLLGTGAQDGHLDFDTATELWNLLPLMLKFIGNYRVPRALAVEIFLEIRQ